MFPRRPAQRTKSADHEIRDALVRLASLDDAVLERQAWIGAARDHVGGFARELGDARRLLREQRRELARLERSPCVAVSRLVAVRAAVTFEELFETAFSRLFAEESERADAYAAALSEAIDLLLEERSGVRAHLPRAVLARYDALLTAGRRPLAWQMAGNCSECGAGVPDDALAPGVSPCRCCEALVCAFTPSPAGDQPEPRERGGMAPTTARVLVLPHERR